MLTSTPMISPNINYYYSSTAVPPPQQQQQQYQHQYQHQHNFRSSPHLPSTTSNNGENILLVYQNSEYIPQPQLRHSSNYESGSASSFTSRSNSSSIMPLSKNSQVRLPPISSLVPSTAYVAHPDQLPSPASHSVMLMSDSCQSAPGSTTFFQQPKNYHHTHNHNHNHNQLLHQAKSAPQMVPMAYIMDNSTSSSLPTRLDSAMAAQMEMANLSRSSSSSISSDIGDAASAAPISNALNPAIRLRKQCPVCGKICSRPSTLKTHYLIHTGDTPFKCAWSNCTKSFNVKSNMLRHLKSHERKLAKKEGCKTPV